MLISGDDPVSKSARRFEVFTDAGKRRDWSDAEKASIVAQCWPRGKRVSAVARRHALDPLPDIRMAQGAGEAVQGSRFGHSGCAGTAKPCVRAGGYRA